jgi:hypothetical protein
LFSAWRCGSCDRTAAPDAVAGLYPD